MEETQQCPIDHTQLTAFNQYNLQDGIICRTCAKQTGLLGTHQSLKLAQAAKALITINVARDYIENNKVINYKEVLAAFNTENNDITESTKNQSISKNDTNDELLEAARSYAKSSTQSSGEESIATIEKANVHDTDNNLDTKSDQEDSSPTSSKKGPIFWKGDGVSGFMYGLVAGALIGIINMVFLNIWHLGIICWIAIWLFVGVNPKFKDKRTPEEQQAALKSHIDEVQKNKAEKRQVPFTINSETERKSKKPLFHGLVCPKCHSANVQLVATDANIKKTKTHVDADLNPLHPLRIANIKQKNVKKYSAAKTTVAMMTMGVSTVVTGGTRSNKSREYHCQDCGKTFYKK